MWHPKCGLWPGSCQARFDCERSRWPKRSPGQARRCAIAWSAVVASSLPRRRPQRIAPRTSTSTGCGAWSSSAAMRRRIGSTSWSPTTISYRQDGSMTIITASRRGARQGRSGPWRGRREWHDVGCLPTSWSCSAGRRCEPRLMRVRITPVELGLSSLCGAASRCCSRWLSSRLGRGLGMRSAGRGGAAAGFHRNRRRRCCAVGAHPGA